MIAHDMPQGSPEWEQIKLGKVGGSRATDILNKGKGRERYLVELACERINGTAKQFSARSTEHGKMTEDQARAVYQIETGNRIEPVGFVELSEYAGCSPDGFVGDDGMIEIKCPIDLSKHIHTVIYGMDDKEHKPQVQFNLMVSGRQWCDFISYSNDAPDAKKIAIWRQNRDEQYIEKLRSELDRFIADLKTMVSQLEAA